MAKETASIVLTTTAYEAITVTHTEVMVQADGDDLRLHIGTSLPAVDTGAFVRLKRNAETIIDALTGVVVYARAERLTTLVKARVIRA